MVVPFMREINHAGNYSIPPHCRGSPNLINWGKMKRAAAEYPTSKVVDAKHPLSAGSIGLQLLDTTWRMTVPVLVFALAGILLDKRLDTAPWITVLGVIIGFVIAARLVYKQIKAVEQMENHK
jgi:Putative F0F1-ATPase subunit Ca2+/Mg2+ transporter